MDDIIKAELEEMKRDIKEIKENHLECMWSAIADVKDAVSSLRWFIMGSVAVLGVVLAILQVCR